MIIKKIFITKISEQAFKSTNEIVDVVEKCLSFFGYKFNMFSYAYSDKGKRVDKCYKYSTNKLLKFTSIDISTLFSCSFLFESDCKKYMFGLEAIIIIEKCKSSGYVVSISVLKNNAPLLNDVEHIYDFFPHGTVKFILADYMNETKSPALFIIGVGGDGYSDYEWDIAHSVSRISTGDGLTLPYLFRTSLMDKSYLKDSCFCDIPKNIFVERNHYCIFNFESMLPENFDEYRKNIEWSKIYNTLIMNNVMIHLR